MIAAIPTFLILVFRQKIIIRGIVLRVEEQQDAFAIYSPLEAIGAQNKRCRLPWFGGAMDTPLIEWTAYVRYRATLRHFDLARIADVVRYSQERYVDNATGRLIAIGKHGRHLVMVPYEVARGVVRPVTVHATTRQQIDSRIKSGRFSYE